ncbi:IpaD/SipD/SspD family type III secretion system needle tip protein [Pinirhizobacter sp.]|jgi:hypothetical protein|uniref:IpaD/SipD/SspD family type III secretion system needle tip protein n=1 Tax=Pinirhizobacter sp. TaxID=2950432 RepID=UPI002F4141E8
MNMHVSHVNPVHPVMPAMVTMLEPESESLGEFAAQEDIFRHLDRLRHSRELLRGATDKLSRSAATKDVSLVDIDRVESDVDEAAKNLLRSKKAMDEMLEAQDDEPAFTPTEQELFDKIKDMLSDLDSGYLAYYQEAITEFTKYFDEIREALNEIKSDGVNGDENGVNFNRNGADILLQGIIDKAWSIGSFSSKAEADKLGESLAPAFKVVQVGDKWEVQIDTRQASDLLAQMPKTGKIYNILFNTWTNKRESAVASLNTAAQATAEAFSRANSTYDNLIKLLSSLIESMMKMMEGFLPT